MRDVGDIHVRLSTSNGGETLIRTDVALTGAVVYLTISREERGWPIVIENASDFPFSISQVVSALVIWQAGHPLMAMHRCAGAQLAQQGRNQPQEKQYQVGPHAELPYAFDLPAQNNKQIRLVTGSKERIINIMEIGSMVPFKFAVSATWACCQEIVQPLLTCRVRPCAVRGLVQGGFARCSSRGALPAAPHHQLRRVAESFQAAATRHIHVHVSHIEPKLPRCRV